MYKNPTPNKLTTIKLIWGQIDVPNDRLDIVARRMVFYARHMYFSLKVCFSW